MIALAHYGASIALATATKVAAVLIPIAMTAAMSVSAAAPQPVAKVADPALQKAAAVAMAPQTEAKEVAFSTVTVAYNATAPVRAMDLQGKAVAQVYAAESTVSAQADKVLTRLPKP